MGDPNYARLPSDVAGQHPLGTKLMVKYNVIEKLVHCRYVLAHVAHSWYIILIPDGDIYLKIVLVQTFSLGSRSCQKMKGCHSEYPFVIS